MFILSTTINVDDQPASYRHCAATNYPIHHVTSSIAIVKWSDVLVLFSSRIFCCWNFCFFI